MSASESETVTNFSAPKGKFLTTIWSDIVRATDVESAQGREALEQLCRNYWYPVYTFIRRQGFGSHEAQDLTQGFFSKFLEKEYLKGVKQNKGKFRSYLMTAIKWYLADQHDRKVAKKRGGVAVVCSLDEEEAERRFEKEIHDDPSPENAYDRQWAQDVLKRALLKLRGEYSGKGGEERFEALSEVMIGQEKAESYAAIGERFGMSEGAVKSAVRRMRQRCGHLFRLEISATVAKAEDVDDEVRYLLSRLSE